MGVVKSGGAARKLGPIGLGRNFTSFKVRDCKRHFTIHEDLLCANSKLFRQRLHKGRKAIEGECSICHEDMDPKVDDITFCKAQCGQNIHKECMEEWKRSRPGLASRCPMCMKVWKHRAVGPIEVEDELDPEAVQLYIDWLYSGQLHIVEDEEYEDENFPIGILKAWKVSSTMEDDEFRYAIIAKYISRAEYDENAGFWSISAGYAFQDEHIESMRKFIIDVFRTYNDPDGWENDWTDSFPTSFLFELFATLMKSETKKDTYKELLEKHTKNHYTIEDDDESNETEDEDDYDSDEAEDEEED